MTSVSPGSVYKCFTIPRIYHNTTTTTPVPAATWPNANN